MKARSYDPRVPLDQLDLPPGEWLLVDDRELVVASGLTLEAAVEMARELKLDLETLAIDRVPMQRDDELLSIGGD